MGDTGEFCGADGSEIGGVREEDAPRVIDVFVEINGTVGGVCLEVRGCVAEEGGHGCCDVGGLGRWIESRRVRLFKVIIGVMDLIAKTRRRYSLTDAGNTISWDTHRGVRITKYSHVTM